VSLQVTSQREARYAALLFLVAGTVAITNSWLPGVTPPGMRLTFTGLGLLDVALAAVLAALPWERWSRRALIAIPLASLVVVDLFAIAGRLDAWISFVFLVVLAFWTGLALPRWSTVWLTGAFAAAYVIPQLAAGRAHEALSTVGLVVPIVVVLGELVANTVAGLRAETMRDELTGVGNRRHGMEVLERLRPGDAVLVLDIDRFKDINVAREAGAATAGLAERLVDDWRRTGPRTTISIGATVHTRAETPTDALARADRALYEAKRGGRDRSCFAG